ncbi:MAG: MmgE/PrpD family protein, partial [Alphaproteobacteria bacterium]
MNVISKTGSAAATDVGTAPIARRLADFTADLGPAAVPGRIAERAKLHVLDCLGIALASTTFEFAQRAANAVRSLGGEGADPAIGFELAQPVRDQAHVDGGLIPGLEVDDTPSDGVIRGSAS